MKLMIESLYDALKAGNVPDELARNAASDVAEFKSEMHDIRRDLAVLKWMAAANLGVCVTVLFKVF